MSRGPYWTTDQIAVLLRMRERNAPWSEISDAIGRPVSSCKDKLAHPGSLTPAVAAKLKQIQVRDVVRPRWTAETEAELLRLRDVEHLSWIEIDGHFGRMHGSCAHKYKNLKANTSSDDSSPPREKKPPSIKVVWTTADMKLAETLWRECAPRDSR